MSVLIKNMEMPKSCNECRFAVDGWCYALLPKYPNTKPLAANGIAEFCPLISVPPKGDLIDEVIRELGLNCCYEMPSFWTNNRKDYKVIATKYHKGYLQALEDVEKAVKQRVGWLESESEGE